VNSHLTPQDVVHDDKTTCDNKNKLQIQLENNGYVIQQYISIIVDSSISQYCCTWPSSCSSCDQLLYKNSVQLAANERSMSVIDCRQCSTEQMELNTFAIRAAITYARINFHHVQLPIIYIFHQYQHICQFLTWLSGGCCLQDWPSCRYVKQWLGNNFVFMEI